MQEGLKIVSSKKLGKKWKWHIYDDGSGYLLAPEGTYYMGFDLQTNEYQITMHSRYELFPLDYYYIDGIKPSEFKPFEYMENEMISYLERNKNVVS